MDKNPDLTIPGMLHDLNNVFQTLLDSADRLSEDPRWTFVSEAIQRTVEMGSRISRSLDSVNPHGPLESIVNDAIKFLEDTRVLTLAPEIRFKKKLEQGIGLKRSWAWERVFINLFLNSGRAMPDGGTIEIEARRSGADIVIAVRDTGCGIPKEILGRLFKPHVSTKAEGGLGLHVVETIVHQDGGMVRAQNRQDPYGAEILISVPAMVAATPLPLAAHVAGG